MKTYPTLSRNSASTILAYSFVAIGAAVAGPYWAILFLYPLIYSKLRPIVATGAGAPYTTYNIDFGAIIQWCTCCIRCKRCTCCMRTKATLPLEKRVTYLFINTQTPPSKNGASVASGAYAAPGAPAPRWCILLTTTLLCFGNLFGQTPAKPTFEIPHFEEHQIHLEYKMKFAESIEINLGEKPHHLAVYFHKGSTAITAQLVKEEVTVGRTTLKVDCGIYYIHASGKGDRFMKLIKLIVSDDLVYVYSIRPL